MEIIGPKPLKINASNSSILKACIIYVRGKDIFALTANIMRIIIEGLRLYSSYVDTRKFSYVSVIGHKH